MPVLVAPVVVETLREREGCERQLGLVVELYAQLHIQGALGVAGRRCTRAMGVDQCYRVAPVCQVSCQCAAGMTPRCTDGRTVGCDGTNCEGKKIVG